MIRDYPANGNGECYLIFSGAQCEEVDVGVLVGVGGDSLEGGERGGTCGLVGASRKSPRRSQPLVSLALTQGDTTPKVFVCSS